MVLQMPTLLNTFETSEANGEGIGSNFQQKIIIEAGALGFTTNLYTSGGSQVASTTETKSLQLIIPAGNASNGIIVFAGLKCQYNPAQQATATQTCRVRVGEDATTTTNNTLVHSITYQGIGGVGLVMEEAPGIGSVITTYSGASWDKTNYVDITFQNSTYADVRGTCNSILVLVF